MTKFADWSTTAVNLAEHASNIIHTDAGAKAAGFEAALVAGVTTYGYLTHVPATAWGLDWVRSGSATVKFKHPVLDGDTVDCRVDGQRVDATVAGSVCATADFNELAHKIEHRVGDVLEPIEFGLDSTWSDYGIRCGDDCPLYTERRIAHPTSWPRIANMFFHEQVVTGPWIHVRSRIAHHAIAPIGSTVRATANVVDRFDSRAGKRAVLDVRITAGGELVAALEHEAIIEIAEPADEKHGDR
jgi:acyl dehydratase